MKRASAANQRERGRDQARLESIVNQAACVLEAAQGALLRWDDIHERPVMLRGGHKRLIGSKMTHSPNLLPSGPECLPGQREQKRMVQPQEADARLARPVVIRRLHLALKKCLSADKASPLCIDSTALQF